MTTPSWIRHVSVGTQLTQAEYEQSSGHEFDYPIIRSATSIVAGSNAGSAIIAQSDYQCDGSADESQIQAAIDALPARESICTVKLIGHFHPAGSIVIPSYTRLDMTEASFDWDVESALFVATGTAAGTAGSSNLSANGTAGSAVISVVDGGGAKFSIGDYVIIRDETYFTGDGSDLHKNGEIHRVVSTTTTPGANTVTLDYSLWNEYTTAGTAVIQKIDMIHDIELIGGKVVGTSATQAKDVYGTWLTYISDFRISGMRFEKLCDRSIFVVSSVRGIIDSNDIWGSARTGEGYGIALSAACSAINIRNNNIDYCRHAFSGGHYDSGGYYGAPIGIIIQGNTLRGGLIGAGCSVLDFHECNAKGIEVNDNVITSTEDADYNGVAFGCTQWSATGNVVTTSGPAFYDRNADDCVKYISLKDNTVLGKYGVHFDAKTLQEVDIDGLYIIGTPDYFAVYCTTDATDAAISIKNVKERNGNYYGIFVTDFASVDITDCDIRNCMRTGIYVENASKGKIHNNICCNNNKGEYNSEGNRSGIYLGSAANISVQSNVCFDDYGTPTQKYGVEEGTVCSSNFISQNKFWGNVTSGVLSTGTSTKVRDNIGYTTENSGTATIAAGSTAVIVTHGLAGTPTVISTTFREQGDIDYGRTWVGSINATTFAVYVNGSPGASALDLGWEAKVR